MPHLPRETPDHAWPYSYWDYLRFVWQRLRPYRGRFLVATLFRITSDIVWLYPAYGIATIINALSAPQTENVPHTLLVTGLLLAAAVAWRMTGQFCSKYFGYQVAEQTALDARIMTTRHLLRVDMQWHERENAGNKLKRIDRGADAVSRTLRLWVNAIIEIVVNFVGVTWIISRTAPGLGISLLVFLATFLVLSHFLTKQASIMENLVDQKEEDMQGLSYEALNNIRTVKALAMTRSLGARLQNEGAEFLRRMRRRILRFQLRSNILGGWGQLFRFGSLFYLALGVFHGNFTLGFLILFQFYFGRTWESVAELSELAPDIVSAKYAIGRMERILREPVRIDDERGKRSFPKDWRTIAVEHLSFSYGYQAVLHDLSFTIRRGERIGIVGLSGAGKSTLFKLFMKENEGYEGTIRFDGEPLREIEKQSYLQSMAAVLQETEVFNFTLRDNITIANPDDPWANLEQALEIAHVNDFLGKLPLGLNTLIGEKGFRLSGGEKQRVGIARAIYKNPQILLLDEATSHLDIESEKKIQDSLHRFFQTVTAIVIAHRLTTIKEMDRILVIEGGRIIESGSFPELQAKRGRFSELWEQQRL